MDAAVEWWQAQPLQLNMRCSTLIELARSIFQLGCSSVSPAASSSSDVPGFLPGCATRWGARREPLRCITQHINAGGQQTRTGGVGIGRHVSWICAMSNVYRLQGLCYKQLVDLNKLYTYTV